MKGTILTAAVWMGLTGPVVGLLVWESWPHHHHADVGPHGGPLADWGGGAYHLEVVSAPGAGVVTVYVLDRWARKPRAIDAAAVTVTLATDPPAEVTLSPAAAEGDPPGYASRFRGAHPGRQAAGAVRGTVRGSVGGKLLVGEFAAAGGEGR